MFLAASEQSLLLWTTHLAGRRWSEMCQGSADAALLPMLLAVATKAGFAAEAAVLGPAHQACMRDKNAAFDALEKASNQ
jgi:hypothetical protein